MCGIVGLHLRNPDLHPRLGELLAQMLGDNGFDEEFRVVSRPDADNRFPAVHLLCRSR